MEGPASESNAHLRARQNARSPHILSPNTHHSSPGVPKPSPTPHHTCPLRSNDLASMAIPKRTRKNFSVKPHHECSLPDFLPPPPSPISRGCHSDNHFRLCDRSRTAGPE